MMKIFISQPMNHRSNAEIKQEREKIKQFAQHKFKVPIYEIPSFIENVTPTQSPLWCLGKSLEYMAEADIVLFAPGWENARGCRIEHMTCLLYDVPTYLINSKEVI